MRDQFSAFAASTLFQLVRSSASISRVRSDAGVVCRLHCRAHLNHHGAREAHFQPTVPSEHVTERLAVEELHHDEWRAIAEVTSIKRLDDVGVPDPACSRGLPKEPLDDVGILTELGVQHLRRPPMLGELVLDLVDVAHASRADTAEHHEPISEHAAWGEQLWLSGLL